MANSNNNRLADMVSNNPHIIPLPSGANRLSYAIPMPYIPSPPRYGLLIQSSFNLLNVRPGMDKGKAEEDPALDNADEEDDGRRNTEINIDMLADRRDSFEVARINSPEVGTFSFTITISIRMILFFARVCDQSTALQ